MSQFFARDFTQDRWRKAALKNAYSLLGKQRFDHAAAFFLLAGSLWDAIQVLNFFSFCMIIITLGPTCLKWYVKHERQCFIGISKHRDES